MHSSSFTFADCDCACPQYLHQRQQYRRQWESVVCLLRRSWASWSPLDLYVVKSHWTRERNPLQREKGPLTRERKSPAVARMSWNLHAFSCPALCARTFIAEIILIFWKKNSSFSIFLFFYFLFFYLCFCSEGSHDPIGLEVGALTQAAHFALSLRKGRRWDKRSRSCRTSGSWLCWLEYVIRPSMNSRIVGSIITTTARSSHVSHVNESCHTCEWICVTHVKELWHTCQRSMSNMNTRIIGSIITNTASGLYSEHSKVSSNSCITTLATDTIEGWL